MPDPAVLADDISFSAKAAQPAATDSGDGSGFLHCHLAVTNNDHAQHEISIAYVLTDTVVDESTGTKKTETANPFILPVLTVPAHTTYRNMMTNDLDPTADVITDLRIDGVSFRELQSASATFTTKIVDDHMNLDHYPTRQANDVCSYQK